MWLWGPAWGVAILLMIWAVRVQRGRPPQRIAYEGALGALMLVAMAVEVPLGPFEYHLTLAGALGMLLGPAGALQAAFIASTVLAFIGHGGLTLIGLNTLLLALAATVAAGTLPALARGREPAVAFSWATGIGHAVSGLAWLGLLALGARLRAEQLGLAPGTRTPWVLGIGAPFVVLGIVAEAAAGYGMARFIQRVRPDLLPSVARPREAAA